VLPHNSVSRNSVFKVAEISHELAHCGTITAEENKVIMSVELT